MKLSEIKTILTGIDHLTFKVADGSQVPSHFHITEVGETNKHFIDCGGTIRNETWVNFQLWTADDYDHRLEAHKLLDIIQLSIEALNIGDHEIEVEYQSDTIGKYGLGFDGTHFILTNKSTDCLARDTCGVPEENFETDNSSCCSPANGCC